MTAYVLEIALNQDNRTLLMTEEDGILSIDPIPLTVYANSKVADDICQSILSGVLTGEVFYKEPITWVCWEIHEIELTPDPIWKLVDSTSPLMV